MMHIYIETVLDLNPYANYMTNQLEIVNEQSYSKETGAIIAIFIAILIFGIMPILIRWSENEIGPNATMFNRCWIASVFFGLWQEISLIHQRWLGEQPILKESLNNQQILLLLATSVFFCATQLFWAWSLTQTSLANSALIHNLTPFFTALGGYLLFNQRFDYKFLIGLIIASVGTIVLGLCDLQIGSIKLQGDLLAFLSALFYAAYFLGIEKLRTQLTVTTILSWIYRIVTLFFVVILLTVKDEWFPHSWNGWLAVITLALALIVSHGLLVYSLKYLSSSFVAMINLFDPAVTGFFAWMIFAEALNWLNLVAFVIIVLGIYLALSSKGAIKSVAE
ncbi:DMT family transporter [Scytonema hofmannii FACHB-248]|uniref:DMT family transporter n=1 Tax=Scytonema hofmannii FACHB-248 TaxID=1842502 RepID=A0ABR8GLG4_9CYAN|nr:MULTISPECIES: DMT family transporter [Nostocales]MBD2603583.1 DMT family transporter [Scytonema hofmannii FACHB-248]